jgi:hypothetical protein
MHGGRLESCSDMAAMVMTGASFCIRRHQTVSSASEADIIKMVPSYHIQTAITRDLPDAAWRGTELHRNKLQTSMCKPWIGRNLVPTKRRFIFHHRYHPKLIRLRLSCPRESDLAFSESIFFFLRFFFVLQIRSSASCFGGFSPGMSDLKDL